MKAYVKPELFFESFELSQTVASCTYRLNSDEFSCTVVEDKDNDSVDMAEMGLFTSKPTCATTGYCYTNGSSSIAVFNS